MREICTSGSVGGRAGNRPAYPNYPETTTGTGGDVRPSLRSALTLPPANLRYASGVLRRGVSRRGLFANVASLLSDHSRSRPPTRFNLDETLEARGSPASREGPSLHGAKDRGEVLGETDGLLASHGRDRDTDGGRCP